MIKITQFSLVVCLSWLSATACTSDPQTLSPGMDSTAASAVSCKDESFCTREYIPTTCSLGTQTFAGSNRCEAMKLARVFACQNKLAFDDSVVSCVAVNEASGKSE